MPPIPPLRADFVDVRLPEPHELSAEEYNLNATRTDLALTTAEAGVAAAAVAQSTANDGVADAGAAQSTANAGVAAAGEAQDTADTAVRSTEASGAMRNLMSKLTEGVSNATIVMNSDSTGATSDSWLLQTAQWLAVQFPAYTVNYYLWDEGGNQWPASPTWTDAGTGAYTLRAALSVTRRSASTAATCTSRSWTSSPRPTPTRGWC
jgi:hypothetical protein